MSRATFTLLGLPVLALVLVAAVATRPAAAPLESASFRFAKAPAGPPAADSAAPISLTASDGTGLALVALEANGVLEPPLAFTELHLTFENPRDQRIEGRFRIALPPGAALSRFAMKNDSGWQEGEVVERQRARVAYEDFLHRRQDPALLEQEAGNEFSARVFPIPARGRKEIIVSYSHALPRADQPYVIPLHGLSAIGRLDLRVFLGGRPASGAPSSNLGGEVSERRVVELHKQDWTPDRDFEIGQDRVNLPGKARAGLRHDNLAVVRVEAPVEAVPQEISGLYVLVDSSASRALGYAAQIRAVGDLITGLRDGAGAATPVGVAAFDQEVVSIFEGPASEFGGTETRALKDRRPLGASDLHQALTWLDQRLARSNGRYPRVLLITDGVATAGETGTGELKAAVHALGSHGVERLDVLAVGGLRDETVLRELTTGNLKHDGQRIDGAAPLAEISRRLTLACRSGIQVKIDGAAWSWPETLDGVQPGDEVLVYADLPADRPLRLTLDGREARLGEIAATERPLLQRAWAQARIDRLIHLRDTAPAGDEDLRRALTLQITEVSVKNRVISPYTAMLVLETEYDYARFGLDRRALADILTVGPGGLEVLARRGADLPRIAQPVDTFKREDPALQSLGYVAGGTGTVAQPVNVPAPGAVEEGVEGGVAGSVAGGVAGGVVGGTPTGVVGSAPAAPDEAPLRRTAGAPPPPVPSSVPPPPPRVAPPAGFQERIAVTRPRPEREEEEKEAQTPPYTGRFAEVKEHLAAGRVSRAREIAEAWSAESPGDVLALLALGEAWEAAGERKAAARAYGSLIDLFPSRADLRRLAGERLERLGQDGLTLAIDTYRKAVLDRPDHPSGHRLLAWALLRAGRYEEAFAALEEGIEQRYPGGRFLGVDRVLREDLGLIGAAWLRAEPGKREQVLDRLRAHEAHLETGPSVRFVLTWETDANDVDLHVWDRKGGHAYYQQKTLPSGGELYADVTTGYGPECFTVRNPEDRAAAPYRLAAHYYNRGPMGYGMGTVQIVRHDGKGGLTVEPRPFVVMTDQAMVELGTTDDQKPRQKSSW
ncbi:MAG TPA: VIT domain-containing protein [Thermoanaerobaculia bacterium]